MRNAAVLALREGDPSAIGVCRRGEPPPVQKLHFPCWQLLQHNPFLLCPWLSRLHRPISKATPTPPRKHAQTHGTFFTLLPFITFLLTFFFLLQNAWFCISVPGALYRRCPLKHKDEITMEPKWNVFFPSCLRCKTAHIFAKNTLQIMQFLADYCCIILLWVQTPSIARYCTLIPNTVSFSSCGIHTDTATHTYILI